MSVRKKEYFCALLTIGMFIYLFPILSSVGFWVSEYLSKALMLNYSIAVTVIIVGLIDCYRRLREHMWQGLGRALGLYLSLSIAMSGIYYLVHLSHKGCYQLPSDIADSPTILDFIYFSFITVTTVGYGDIVPKHTFVRVLVLFQVFCGLLIVLHSARCSTKD